MLSHLGVLRTVRLGVAVSIITDLPQKPIERTRLKNSLTGPKKSRDASGQGRECATEIKILSGSQSRC